MQTHLYLYILSEEIFQWILINQGERMPCTEGNLETLSSYLSVEGISQSEVTVVLAGNLASYVSTQLTSQQLKYVSKALPFALEENISQDHMDLQIVIANKEKGGQVIAWLVDKLLLLNLKERLGQINLKIKYCYVDTDLLPTETSCQILITEDKHLLISDKNLRSYGTIDWLAVLSDQFKPASSITLHCPENYSEADIVSHQIASLFEQEVEQKTYSNSSFNELINYLLLRNRQAVNIWTGEFAPVNSNPKIKRWVIQGLGMLLLSTILFTANQLVEINRISEQIEAYSKSISTLCKDIYGQQKQCREVLLKREVSSLLNKTLASSSSDNQLISNFDAIGKYLKGETSVDSIRYDNSRFELLLTVRGSNFQVLEQFKNDLSSQGLQVELAASQQSNYTRGNIKISLQGGQ